VKKLLLLLAFIAVLLPPPAQARPGALDISFGTRGKSIQSVPLNRRVEEHLSSPSLARLRDGRSVALAGNTLFVLRPDGRPDRRFGGGRIEVTSPADASLQLVDVAGDASGRILVAGTFDEDAFVARFTRDGALDPTFGLNGVLRTDFNLDPPPVTWWPDLPPSPPLTQLTGIALEPNGRIVLSGVHVKQLGACRGHVNYPYREAFVARISEGGDLDSSFGQKGVAFVPETPAIAPPTVVPGPSEALYLLDRPIWGECDVPLRQRVVRMGPNGAIEGSAHVADTEFGEYVKIPAIALDRRGRILMVEPGEGNAARVRRLAGDGFDRSFGKNGVARIGAPGFGRFIPSAVRVDQTGKIVVAGTTGLTDREGETRAILLARLTTGGTLDHHFGRDGKVLVRFGRHARMGPPNLALARGGTVLLGAEIARPSFPDGEGLAFARYLSH
jgi:uncharacterized delta-60 repeat protein